MIMGKRLEDIHPIREELVRPAGGSAETWWLASFAVLVVLVSALAIGTRGPVSRVAVLSTWQVNAFTGLNSSELGTFNALYTSAMEIDAVHEDGDGGWLDVPELEELFIPPFARDAAWRRQGKLHWKRNIPVSERMDIALYLGVPEDRDVSGAFLLVMLHDHAKKQGNASAEHARFEVWHNTATKVKFPIAVTDQALIAAGWKEVVALKGEDEIRRVRGEVVS